jgi:hypothetical protein
VASAFNSAGIQLRFPRLSLNAFVFVANKTTGEKGRDVNLGFTEASSDTVMGCICCSFGIVLGLNEVTHPVSTLSVSSWMVRFRLDGTERWCRLGYKKGG